MSNHNMTKSLFSIRFDATLKVLFIFYVDITIKHKCFKSICAVAPNKRLSEKSCELLITVLMNGI